MDSAEFVAEYRDLLAQLKRNEKRDINVLSMLAEDNKQHAPAIVRAIEKHILVVRARARACAPPPPHAASASPSRTLPLHTAATAVSCRPAADTCRPAACAPPPSRVLLPLLRPQTRRRRRRRPHHKPSRRPRPSSCRPCTCSTRS
jgi:hypothetical protein